jgi:glycerophosphoryl diester phosphodiesterase
MSSRASWIRIALVALALVALLAPTAALGKKKHKRSGPPKENSPLVIGHRGAAGYLPDHTLAGYRLAIKLGADYIEPDLVATKDGVLIARHEPNITATTDVADHTEFLSKKRTGVVIDGGPPEDGWFASDFTLAEIKTLRAKQPFPERPHRFDGKFEVPTFQEIINMVKRESRKRGRKIGIYPETKHPTYHKGLGLPLEGRLVNVLKRNGLNHRSARVFIQSFEQSNLKQLNHMTPVRLVQLVDAFDTDVNGDPTYEAPNDRPYDWTVSGDPVLQARTFGYFATDAGLADIKTYADGIGPWKVYIVGTYNNKIVKTTDLIKRAHDHGLLIHTWTFRSEQSRLAEDYAEDPLATPPMWRNPVNEYLKFYKLGIDGVFSDYTDDAVVARELFRLGG